MVILCFPEQHADSRCLLPYVFRAGMPECPKHCSQGLSPEMLQLSPQRQVSHSKRAHS